MTQPTTGIILTVLLLVLASVTAAADTLTITARQAVVRAGPDSKRAALATAAQGTTFTLLESRQGWYKVLLNDGREGWVAHAAAEVQSERGFAVVPAVAAATSARSALVIGNAAYSEDIGALKNPGNDATDMAATLRQLGFAVTLLQDATHQRMGDAVEDFTRQLRPGSVGVFYYAGHGAQVGGRNYLIPLGARITSEAAVLYQAVAAEEVLARMEAAGQGKALNVLILDACRNAPFMRGWRSPLRGLAPMQATGGSLIAYATSPGSVAKDGAGRNGTYTQHLLRFMTEPNLPVELMFKQVRLAVEHETNGEQIPWELSSLKENFAFHTVAAGGPSPPVTAPPSRPVLPDAPVAGPSVADLQAQVDAQRQQVQAERQRLEEAQRLQEEQRKLQAEQERLRQEREKLQSPAPGTQVAVGVYPQAPAAPKTLRNSLGMEFVLLPAGEFQMGSSNDGDGDEKPVHTVRITKPFYLGKYEVTQGQWEAVMGNNPSSFKGNAALPVERVSWKDVQVFLGRLNARERGAPYRLPTEAEWEYAARAGSSTAYSFGSSAGELGRYAWCSDNAGGKTHPVGQLQPNAWGLYDMYGNVWEWVQDWKGTYPSGTVSDPAGPASGSFRVTRGGGWGGGWSGGDRYCRSASRHRGSPDGWDVYLGFRLLRTAE